MRKRDEDIDGKTIDEYNRDCHKLDDVRVFKRLEDKNARRREIARKAAERKVREEEKKGNKPKKPRNERHECECGGKYITMNKCRHEKTKKHLSFVS